MSEPQPIPRYPFSQSGKNSKKNRNQKVHDQNF